MVHYILECWFFIFAVFGIIFCVAQYLVLLLVIGQLVMQSFQLGGLRCANFLVLHQLNFIFQKTNIFFRRYKHCLAWSIERIKWFEIMNYWHTISKVKWNLRLSVVGNSRYAWLLVLLFTSAGTGHFRLNFWRLLNLIFRSNDFFGCLQYRSYVWCDQVWNGFHFQSYCLHCQIFLLIVLIFVEFVNKIFAILTEKG